MRKLLLALALFLIPSFAMAQCNGVFPASNVCGTTSSGANIPGPLPLSSFALAPGGVSGNVQTNNGSGGLAGITSTQLTTLVNPFTSVLSGAVPASGGSSTTLFLNQAGAFAPISTAAQPVFNITSSPYNAKCNFSVKLDVAMANGSTTATSASGWSAGDVGKYIIVQGAGAGISSANAVITSGNASIATGSGNAFAPFQFVTFTVGAGSNIVAGGAYYISSTGLSGAAFQVSATPGGAVITPNGSSTPVAVTSGNLTTTIASFINSTTVTLTSGNASTTAATGRVIEFGNDDAAAINSAIAAANVNGGTVYIPVGICLVSQLNMANITRGLTLKGEGISSSVLMPMQVAAYSTTHGHVIDLTGSAQVILQDFQLGSFGSMPVPTTGIFMAQVPSNVANRIRMERIYITGQYSGATLYVYGVPSWDCISSDFYNYSPGAGNKGVAYFTNSNAFNYTSSNGSLATPGTTSTSDIHFFDTEFHKFAWGGADNWVLRFDGPTNIALYGGVVSGGASAYSFYDGTVLHISYFNVTFETENQPVIPTNAHLKNTGTVTDMNDVGSSYIITGAKFNPGASTTNLVTNSQ